MLVDARGMLCPWPAIRLARAIRTGDGAPIDLWADDPKAAGELAEVAQAAGWTCAAEGAGRFRIARAVA